MADKARKAAVQAVIKVHKGGWANLAAKSALAGPSLTDRDRAFAGALFYGTCERLVTLDAVLQPFSKKPLAKLDVEVRAILETGLYQALYMKVPVSAAVNESVTLARAFGKSSAAGFVNAVLRKAAKCDPAALPYKDEAERLMLAYSVSRPVAEAVMASLDDPDAFFAGSFAAPELCLRVNTLRTTPEALARRLEEGGGKVREGPVPGSLYARLPGGVAEEPAFREGLYHVQGAASQLVCACVDPKPGERVLDLCAAPGGKSATMAERMGGGTGLTACELHPHRVELIRETLERLGIEGAEVRQNDGAVFDEGLAGQDRVLCDVPCSGLGVLAKKPDLRLNDGSGFAALPELQLEILRTAARYVKEGGRLVYATCTIRREENGDVVRRFLEAAPDFRLETPEMVPGGAIVEDGMTLLPQHTGMDGFFVAQIARLC